MQKKSPVVVYSLPCIGPGADTGWTWNKRSPCVNLPVAWKDFHYILWSSKKENKHLLFKTLSAEWYQKRFKQFFSIVHYRFLYFDFFFLNLTIANLSTLRIQEVYTPPCILKRCIFHRISRRSIPPCISSTFKVYSCCISMCISPAY